MQDKTILITGATSGIGKETAKALAKRGARILFNSRNNQKGEETCEELKAYAGHKNILQGPCDLASLEQIKDFGNWATQQTSKIDVLIHNAGVFPTSTQLSDDQYELGWAVNYLASFLLTQQVIDKVKVAPQGRIIFVSSTVHKLGELSPSQLPPPPEYFKPFAYYGKSKLAQMLFMKELALRLAHTNISTHALHPGVIGTNITRDFPPFIQSLFRLFFKSPEAGAQTTIFLASDPQLQHASGKYFINKKERKYHRKVNDASLREALWHATCKELGLSPDWV